MKVEIENTVADIDLMQTIFKIVTLAKNSKSINELIKMLDATKLVKVIYGSGSNHVWVKEKNKTNRILLIT